MSICQRRPRERKSERRVGLHPAPLPPPRPDTLREERLHGVRGHTRHRSIARTTRPAHDPGELRPRAEERERDGRAPRCSASAGRRRGDAAPPPPPPPLTPPAARGRRGAAGESGAPRNRGDRRLAAAPRYSVTGLERY
ncbi:unnamed protein product [Merluccius merluccius]